MGYSIFETTSENLGACIDELLDMTRERYGALDAGEREALLDMIDLARSFLAHAIETVAEFDEGAAELDATEQDAIM
jgi:hypothetical protein